MSKTAIILGATGLTGGLLLKKLIADNRYKTIKIFSRKSVKIKSEKIQEYIVDLLELSEHKKDFTADEVFCCIGTTTKKTKDKLIYKAIDYGIPVIAARLAKENGIKVFLVISSMGSNASSSIFYNKTKGEMERDVLKQKIKHTYILRPSLIGGHRNEFRFGESIVKLVMKVLHPFFLGNLKKYRMIHPEKIIDCMIILANKSRIQSIFNSEEIETINKLTPKEFY